MNKNTTMKKQEQEEWHNPEGIPKRKIPRGCRMMTKREFPDREAITRKCAVLDDSNGRWIWMEDECYPTIGYTYIVRIEDDAKPEPPSLPDTGSRTEFDAGAVTMTKREQILREAIKCTTKDRQHTHGKPENSFADIAHLWSWYKDVQFSPQDVAVMMGLMKMARIKSNPIYDDNMVDLAGYIAISAELGGESK